MKFSIITLTKNNCQTLERALLSLIDQTYKDYQHIVVDAGSTDCTQQIIRKYSQYITTILQDKGHGIYSALNMGIRAATGDVIGLLHADDFFADQKILEDIAQLFEQGADIVYGDVIFVLPDGKIWRYWRAGKFHKRKLHFGWMPPHTTMFVRGELFKRYGLYREDMRIAADYDMVLRLFTKDLVVKYLPRVITVMSAGGESNKSLGNILQKMKEDRRAAKDNGFNGWITVMFKNLRKLGQLRSLGHLFHSKAN